MGYNYILIKNTIMTIQYITINTKINHDLKVNGKSPTLPIRASAGAAGSDLCAAISEPLTLNPGEWFTFKTGLHMSIPDGVAGLVIPRSGLAHKNGLTVLNGPGLIDGDYTGDVGVILVNQGVEPLVIEPGMRVAQILFVPFFAPQFVIVDELENTERGEGGFGSTGLK